MAAVLGGAHVSAAEAAQGMLWRRLLHHMPFVVGFETRARIFSERVQIDRNAHRESPAASDPDYA